MAAVKLILETADKDSQMDLGNLFLDIFPPVIEKPDHEA